MEQEVRAGRSRVCRRCVAGDHGHDSESAAEKRRKEIEEAANPAEMRQQMIREYTETFANPYVAASRGYIDDVIEPRETRPRLINALEMLSNKRDNNPPKKHGCTPL